MPTGAENVRSWGQTGSDRPTRQTALLTHLGHLAERADSLALNVGCWHETDIPGQPDDVRSWGGYSGPHAFERRRPSLTQNGHFGPSTMGRSPNQRPYRNLAVRRAKQSPIQ